MAKQKSKKGGCLRICLIAFLVCIALALAALTIPIAVGVGAWFLIRFIWRKAVAKDPNNPIIAKGLALSPAARKVMAAIPCALLACGLITSTTAPYQKTKDEPAATTSQAISETVAAATDEAPVEQDIEVSFIDVGQGDAVFLRLPNGKTMLVDAGPDASATAVEQELTKQGVDKIDYLIATHADSDHISGMAEVASNHEVGEFLAPQSTHTTDTFLSLLQTIKDKGITSHAAWAGDVLAYGDDFSVRILSPVEGQNYTESNDWSVVLLVTYGNTKLLLTGDAPKEILKNLDVGPVDVLKVSHHGSDTGTDADLISMLSPKYAVISYGIGNEYGHPTQGVLDALGSAAVYGTGVNGTIRMASDGSSYEVNAEKEGAVVSPAAETPETAAQSEAAPQAEAPAAADPAPQADQSEETVLVTPKGHKYHRPGCRYTSGKSCTELTKSQAQAQGYEPCSKCNP